jgi:uncharacterized protein (DUF885 family)
MRIRNRIILLVVGVLAIGVTAFAVPTVWFKPYTVEHLYVRMFARVALQSPMMMSQLQFLPPALDFYSGKLDDRSLAFAEKQTRQLERELAILRRYDREELRDRLSYDVAEWAGADMLAGLQFRFHGYPLSQMDGEQSALPSFMLSTHRIRSARDARNYVARLEQFDTYFFHVLEDLNLREQRGITPPRFVVDRVLAEMRGFIAQPPTEHVLYVHLRAMLDSLPDMDVLERAAVLAGADSALTEHVYPAYRRLIAYGEHLARIATTDDGVWKLPDGAAFYQYQLRHHTSTDMTADQIHQLGLQEVARIQAEIRTILRRQGHAASDIATKSAELFREPRFQWPDTDAGRAAVLAEYQRIIDEIGGGLDSLFGVRPKAHVRIERVPAFKEATTPLAYYNSPALDGSRPGIFFVNLRDVSNHARPRMRTLAYHEAIPGHHLQHAVAQELQGVPFFRKVVGFTAFAEGWGLYAEQLAAEAGFQDDPYNRIGFLLDQLWRAVRLVVDTGIHDKRWTREQAIDYMRKQTGKPEAEVVTEIERYIVLPGQATAYMVGRLKILELRERARQQLGERFDLREFHSVVLGNGEIPLVLLERTVDEWIASKS